MTTATNKSTSDNICADIAPSVPDSEPCLHVTVIFTTAEATLMALRTAGQLARSLADRITLVAVEVVPFRLALGLPLVPRDFREQRLLALVAQSEIEAAEVRIEIFLCRDRRQCLEQILRPRSLVVIGGKRHWWSREQRLGRWIRRLGHQVVFVDGSHARSTHVRNVNEPV